MAEEEQIGHDGTGKMVSGWSRSDPLIEQDIVNRFREPGRREATPGRK
jgi:hypothetical protein